jgi:hypothetical protein
MPVEGSDNTVLDRDVQSRYWPFITEIMTRGAMQGVLLKPWQKPENGHKPSLGNWLMEKHSAMMT